MPEIFNCADFDRTNFARVKEIAAEIGISRQLIYRLFDRGDIRGFKLTEKILLIEIASVREWFETKIKTL